MDSAGTDPAAVNHHDFIPDELINSGKAPTAPRVHLLYRPGHYDVLYPLEEGSQQGLGGDQGTQAASGGYGGTSSIEGVGYSAVSGGGAGSGLDQESVSRAFAAAMAAAKGSLSSAHHAPATSGS